MSFSIKNILCGTAFFCLIFFCCSCSILPAPQKVSIHYYDLGIPSKIFSSTKGNISVRPFVSFSGERFRMVRRKGNLLYNDDNNKWQMPPGSLVTKYLTLSYRSEGKAAKNIRPDIMVGGKVTAFEMDNDTAILGISYHVRMPAKKDGTAGKSWERNILIREKCAGKSAADYASGMSKAMAKAAKMIIEDINSK